jgi:phytoene dehydrogenase-like protein
MERHRVGSGIGGLCASAMCSPHCLKTVCVEAHDVASGVAHSFEHRSLGGDGGQQHPFVFESGPSLLLGMSARGTNLLRQVLDAVGVAHKIEWVTYDGWMVSLLF